MPETLDARTSVAWMEVLGRLETTLEESLAQTAASESDSSSSNYQEADVFSRLDQRLDALATALDQAEANAAEVDMLLLQEAERAKKCVEALAAAKQRLIEWSARPF